MVFTPAMASAGSSQDHDRGGGEQDPASTPRSAVQVGAVVDRARWGAAHDVAPLIGDIDGWIAGSDVDATAASCTPG
ncbi:MAG TPA: hypothetical protein VFM27_09855 [Acidimicrobiales bacterium]|nr:hypothetical protein [Acidimicrobiales bacterium]